MLKLDYKIVCLGGHTFVIPKKSMKVVKLMLKRPESARRIGYYAVIRIDGEGRAVKNMLGPCHDGTRRNNRILELCENFEGEDPFGTIDEIKKLAADSSPPKAELKEVKDTAEADETPTKGQIYTSDVHTDFPGHCPIDHFWIEGVGGIDCGGDDWLVSYGDEIKRVDTLKEALLFLASLF